MMKRKNKEEIVVIEYERGYLIQSIILLVFLLTSIFLTLTIWWMLAEIFMYGEADLTLSMVVANVFLSCIFSSIILKLFTYEEEVCEIE